MAIFAASHRGDDDPGIYNLIDSVFVGRALGDDGIAAMFVAFPFMLILMSFGMLIGFGAAALISIRLGERNKPEAEKCSRIPPSCW